MASAAWERMRIVAQEATGWPESAAPATEHDTRKKGRKLRPALLQLCVSYEPGRLPTGLSKFTPQMTDAKPPVAYCVYQVPVLGRQTVKSLFPSPSQSPVTGMSLFWPQTSWIEPPVDFEMN